MTKSPLPMLRQLDARLQEQALKMDSLRAALDTQLKRIAQMQADLDVLPRARKHPHWLRAHLAQPSSRPRKRA
jgi:hypothetical protein